MITFGLLPAHIRPVQEQLARAGIKAEIIFLDKEKKRPLGISIKDMPICVRPRGSSASVEIWNDKGAKVAAFMSYQINVR